MRRYLTPLIILVVTLVIGIIYGILIGKYEAFPYKYVKKSFNYLSNKCYGPWSIGIYNGPTPFDLTDSEATLNPVLTGKDIDDIDARFVADPFMVIENGNYSMFFEVMNRETSHGDIGYAESQDGVKWKYGGIIIDENFHLSYPYVFKWKGNYYLIPESHKDLSIRLYIASSFPGKWKYIGNIMAGHRYIDPSIFRFNNKWWLFASIPGNDVLNLYYSYKLRTGWVSHPMNPIVKFDKNISRPAGRVLIYDGNIYRFTQDDDPSYGIQVFAFKITKLSENSYEEKILSEEPVVKMTGEGWNAAGMHHVDVQEDKGRWIATVDGKSKWASVIFCLIK